MAQQKDIYVELTKSWGGFPTGSVVRFGQSKGEAVINAGKGKKVRRQACVNERDKPPRRSGPVVERTVAPPAAEQAVVVPQSETPTADLITTDEPAETEKPAAPTSKKRGAD
jgi:hypothetical protein